MRLLVIDGDMTREQEEFLGHAMTALGLAHRLIVLEENTPQPQPVMELRADTSVLRDILDITFSAIGNGCNYFPGLGRLVQNWYGLKEIIGPARWARAERAARQAAQFFWRMVPLRHEQSRRMYDWRSSPRWGRERWRSIT